MNKNKFNAMLAKLELQMRRAELHGDALLVAHYNELIADLIYAQSEEGDRPKIGSGGSDAVK